MPTFVATDACRESGFSGTWLTAIRASLPHTTAAHHRRCLPANLKGKPDGHSGSHQYLVDDFSRAGLEDALPPTHGRASGARCAPGLVAHQSALAGGAPLPVPDFGQPPADWRRLNYPDRGEAPARPRMPDLIRNSPS